jgi:hypothetical protein
MVMLILRRILIFVILVVLLVGHSVAQLGVADLVKKSSDAVVLIVISNSAGQETALGSGFVVSADGEIATNYHVIKEAHSAVVKLSNGAFFPVSGVLAADPDKDLAIIKVSGKNLPFLSLERIDKLHVGDRVVAIGSPLGLEGTVSDGIVSALRDDGDKKWIQTTAPVSHGNSGGPLLNMSNHVVGVITWGKENGQNLNFAAPSNELMTMLETAHQQPKPLETVASKGDSENHSKLIIERRRDTEGNEHTGLRADCSILESPQSCLIFNEVAGNENSDLFRTLTILDKSIVCFPSPVSREQDYLARRFEVFSLSTSLDSPTFSSMYVRYENGIPASLQFFYLIPLPTEGFEVKGTGQDVPFGGELLPPNVFSFAQLGHADGLDGQKFYSWEIDLLSGRMNFSSRFQRTNHSGRCFSFDNEKRASNAYSPEEIEKLRMERASRMTAEIAATEAKEREQTKRENECAEQSFRQLCPSCSHEDYLKRTVQAMIYGSTDSEMRAIFKKCQSSIGD